MEQFGGVKILILLVNCSQIRTNNIEISYLYDTY